MDRNCSSSYPIYQGGFLPGPLPMPMGTTPFMNFNGSNNDDINSLTQRINSLEQRVNNLENVLGNSSYSSTSYNTTNYQMM